MTCHGVSQGLTNIVTRQTRDSQSLGKARGSAVPVPYNFRSKRLIWPPSVQSCLRFLADRTNCRAYASVASVCRLYVVAKRCVLGQKLLLAAYRKSHMRNRLVPN